MKKSVNECKIPGIWKLGSVTAIFKSGSKLKPENYRPISLTSVPGKILERIIRNEIVEHMTNNSLFSRSQHGFLVGKSCTTQLLEFLEDVTDVLDQGTDVDVIYLDFRKAFDQVPHKRLLKKLNGIRDRIHAWIKDFLTDRKQYAKVDGKSSELVRVTSGVPKGSVLGPILFLIFINALPEVVTAIITLFADEIYRGILTMEHAYHLQANIDNAVIWADQWKMFYNFKKCKHLHIGSRNEDIKYTMNTGHRN